MKIKAPPASLIGGAFYRCAGQSIYPAVAAGPAISFKGRSSNERSGRTADIAVGQAAFVAVIPALGRFARGGPEFYDALADALLFVGYNRSVFHGGLLVVLGFLRWPSQTISMNVKS